MSPLLSRMGRRQEHATWTSLKRVLEAREASAYPADPSPDATLRHPRGCDNELVESWALLYPMFDPLSTGRTTHRPGGAPR